MKRNALLRHLRVHGCKLIREGGSHSWWGNPDSNLRSSVPRHTEIKNQLARKICKDMGIPKAFVEEAHVAYGTPVDLSVNDGKIVIEPHHAEPGARLEDLLKGVTERNVHAEVETGEAVGREIW